MNDLGIYFGFTLIGDVGVTATWSVQWARRQLARRLLPGGMISGSLFRA